MSYLYHYSQGFFSDRDNFLWLPGFWGINSMFGQMFQEKTVNLVKKMKLDDDNKTISQLKGKIVQV